MRTLILAICTITLVLVAACAWAGYISAPPGYSIHEIVFALPPGAFPASFDILPSGEFVVHTGRNILKVAWDGTSEVLFTYPEDVFGSFVTVDPERARIIFGESSYGGIKVMGLDGHDSGDAGVVPFHFDLEVDASGRPFVVSTPGFGSGICEISILDPNAGTLDLIAQVPGATGPLAFDRRDNLVCGTVSPRWGEQGGQKILRFSAEQVESAVGEGWLTAEDAEVLADDVDSAYDLAFDMAGRICFTSTVSAPSAIWRVNQRSVDLMSSVDPSTYHDLPALRWNRRTHGFSVMVGGVFDQSLNAVGVISTLVRGQGR